MLACDKCLERSPAWFIKKCKNSFTCKFCILKEQLLTRIDRHLEPNKPKSENSSKEVSFDIYIDDSSTQVDIPNAAHESIVHSKIDNSSLPHEELFEIIEEPINDINACSFVLEEEIAKNVNEEEERIINDWITVSGKSGIRNIENKGLALSNSFQVLDNYEEVEPPVVLKQDSDDYTIIGSSIIKHFKKNKYRGKNRVERQIHSYSGGGIDEVIYHLENYEMLADTVVIHTGGNDILKKNSEELKKKFKIAIENIRSRGKKCVISSILPRNNQSNLWYSKAIGINEYLKNLCQETNSTFFVDTWFDFYNSNKFLSRDGVHLSRAGVSFLSNRLDQAVQILSGLVYHRLLKRMT